MNFFLLSLSQFACALQILHYLFADEHIFLLHSKLLYFAFSFFLFWIGSNLSSIDKLVVKLERLGHTLHFVYEAGPCGYTIYRHLRAKGIDCAVVAPSQIPKRSGDRVKTNRRDAINLARLHRAGELSCVYVPLPEDEAMRDLSRAREDAKQAEVKAKQQLSA